jgi:hypothetical protein
VLRRIRIRAVASERSLQLADLYWLDQMSVETCGEASVADVVAGVASESDQIELRRRKPSTQTTREFKYSRSRRSSRVSVPKTNLRCRHGFPDVPGCRIRDAWQPDEPRNVLQTISVL